MMPREVRLWNVNNQDTVIAKEMWRGVTATGACQEHLDWMDGMQMVVSNVIALELQMNVTRLDFTDPL